MCVCVYKFYKSYIVSKTINSCAFDWNKNTRSLQTRKKYYARWCVWTYKKPHVFFTHYNLKFLLFVLVMILGWQWEILVCVCLSVWRYRHTYTLLPYLLFSWLQYIYMYVYIIIIITHTHKYIYWHIFWTDMTVDGHTEVYTDIVVVLFPRPK